MQFLPGHIYHVYNQGNNKEKIFFERTDYILFLKKMNKALNLHCSILAWCLMPNHFHWLIEVSDDYNLNEEPDKYSGNSNTLNKNIGILLSSYTQSLNRKYDRSGSLFRKRTKAKSLNELQDGHNEYLLNCFLYIHQNPLKAGLTDQLEDWEFSSFPDFCELRNGTLCDVQRARDLMHLPKTPKEFYEFSYQTLPDGIIKKLL